MNRSKTWVKDRHFEYKHGDIVKLVRKKNNGHPRSLSFGISYKVLKVENEDLFVQELDGDIQIKKANKNYFIPVEKLRDELINEILKNGEGW
jgi:calcineurin-like phosphoesterase